MSMFQSRNLFLRLLHSVFPSIPARVRSPSRLDSTGAARNPFSNLTVLLSTTSGGGIFYSNSSCNSTTTSVVIASNKTSMDFWYKDSNNGQPLITASTSYEAGPNLSATQLETIGTPCTAAAVTTQPTNQSITYGQNAAFTAAASGNPTPTVQWQVDTGSGFTNISGATSTTLTLTTPPVSASGNKYRAVFTNTCSGTQTATTSAATLTVAARATSTTISPLTASTPAGVAAIFTITVTDTDSGTKSNPAGTIASSSTSSPANTDSISACTLAQGANPLGTVSCQVNVTPTTPFAVHTINASFTATDSVHSNSSTTTGATLTVSNPDTKPPVVTISF